MSGISAEEISEALSGLPGWRYDRGEIFKQYKFDSFGEAIAFINRIAERAEAADHHPDLENHYNRVRVGLHTWNENAVTEKDIALAQQIESVAASVGG
jgi:4a-hydroxytetrahydrobiopterin dehydratase